jgi:hypothetical protein
MTLCRRLVITALFVITAGVWKDVCGRLVKLLYLPKKNEQIICVEDLQHIFKIWVKKGIQIKVNRMCFLLGPEKGNILHRHRILKGYIKPKSSVCFWKQTFMTGIKEWNGGLSLYTFGPSEPRILGWDQVLLAPCYQWGLSSFPCRQHFCFGFCFSG